MKTLLLEQHPVSNGCARNNIKMLFCSAKAA